MADNRENSQPNGQVSPVIEGGFVHTGGERHILNYDTNILSLDNEQGRGSAAEADEQYGYGDDDMASDNEADEAEIEVFNVIKISFSNFLQEIDRFVLSWNYCTEILSPKVWFKVHNKVTIWDVSLYRYIIKNGNPHISVAFLYVAVTVVV